MSNKIESPEGVGMSSKRLDRIGVAMQRYVDDGTLRGVSTMVMRKGEVVHAEQFGYRDAEAGLEMTYDTIFRIYSMTKPIVSTALMLLHEESAFQLEDPVAKYLPAFGATQVLGADGSLSPQARPMEIRDLLTHTSGLTYDFMEDTPVGHLYRDARIMNDATRTLEELIDALATIPLASQPGDRWHYSVGIDVAARLIEVMSGQPLGAFLTERIFNPLSMTDTGFGVVDSQLNRLSAMYGLPDLFGQAHTGSKLVEAALSGFNQRIDVSTTYPARAPEVFLRGGIGLFSTIGDYANFAQMLLNRGRLNNTRIIGRKTLELMHANHLAAELLPWELLGQDNHGFGFGLGSRVMMDVASSAGPGSVGEHGWMGAAKTYYWVDPKEELVGLFMAQYMTGVALPDRAMRSLTYQAIDD
jgi:CubicO group peptidase (beta-lactamase class C family)